MSGETYPGGDSVIYYIRKEVTQTEDPVIFMMKLVAPDSKPPYQPDEIARAYYDTYITTDPQLKDKFLLSLLERELEEVSLDPLPPPATAASSVITTKNPYRDVGESERPQDQGRVEVIPTVRFVMDKLSSMLKKCGDVDMNENPYFKVLYNAESILKINRDAY